MTPAMRSTSHGSGPSRQIWEQHNAADAGSRFWPNEELVRAVSRRSDVESHTVVEVGCGNGANLWFLAEAAHNVIGVDFTESALMSARRYMRQRQAANVALVQGDVNRLPLADASVDGIVDVMVSQHVPFRDHVTLFREYRRVLALGGWLFLYHLGMGTSARGSQMVSAFTHDCLPLFPVAGLVSLPPAWAMTEALAAAGFSVSQPRSSVRIYPDGDVAHYLVCEGETV